MNPTALRFIREYEHEVYEGAKYARQYGDLQRLYDASSDDSSLKKSTMLMKSLRGAWYD
ncbi:hypothetical protein [Acinetobacter baumannii]|uniref:hypothetical protein n=1 Tax=Acinetobacter baumannii TaxID=470 RepID=UPI0021C728D8|nr:hypothetical protein [Acinetobacter baumannii]